MFLKIDVDPLIENLVERTRHDEESQNEGIKSQLEEAITKRHETEAKLGQAESRIVQLEETIKSGYLTVQIKDERVYDLLPNASSPIPVCLIKFVNL